LSAKIRYKTHRQLLRTFMQIYYLYIPKRHTQKHVIFLKIFFVL